MKRTVRIRITANNPHLHNFISKSRTYVTMPTIELEAILTILLDLRENWLEEDITAYITRPTIGGGLSSKSFKRDVRIRISVNNPHLRNFISKSLQGRVKSSVDIEPT